MFSKIKNTVIKNKFLYFILFLFFITMLYAGLNTLIINDDLGYSFLYRTPKRITNIIEVLKMQISDYRIVSSRVFIHTIVQTLLIFGKNVWSFLNPLVVILNFYYINKIVKLYVKDNKVFNYIYCLILFLLMANYKWIIYWVAGSVNYVWTSALLFAYIYIYLKYGFSKKNWLNILLLLILSIMHESTFVFSFIFILFIIIYEYIFNKKFDKKMLLLFIPLIISGIFIFLGPGTLSRMNSYSELSLLEKLKISLPVISLNLYNLKDINNIIPIVFILTTIIRLFKYKENNKYIFIILNIICILVSVLSNNNIFYFILSILILFSNFYINYKENRNELNILLLSFYAIAYSLCLTEDYISGRPNYFVFIYMIFMSLIYFYEIFDKKAINKSIIFITIVFMFLLVKECYIYNKIGNLKNDRLIAIEKYKNGDTDKLYYRLMDEKYYIYQIDLNQPLSKDYYSYKYFIDYYNLPEDTEFEFIN